MLVQEVPERKSCVYGQMAQVIGGHGREFGQVIDRSREAPSSVLNAVLRERKVNQRHESPFQR